MSFRLLILWLHLLGVVVWIGGLVFRLLVVLPALGRLRSQVEQVRLGLGLDVQFRTVMWPAAGLVLLTGLYNVINVLYATALAGGSVPAAFVRLLSLKLLLVALMLVLLGVERFAIHPRSVVLLTSLSAGVTELPDALRKLRRLSRLLRILVLLVALVVLLLGVLLRG
jgi:uncharacterized membrane protein